MGTVEVRPAVFEILRFSHEAVVAVAERVLGLVGLDVDLVIEIDESTPLASIAISSHDPLVLSVQGGAFEDTRRPRNLSEQRTADALGRLLLRVADRRDPSFGDPPDDADLSFAQWTAWDVHSVGRLVRLGLPGQRTRRLYQFRSRHGFTDLADAAFERLWHGEVLTWADIDAISRSCLVQETSTV